MSNAANGLEYEVFPWNTNFETGIEEIDAQHRRLVHLINLLASHLSADEGQAKIDGVFVELAEYADYHFKSEESVWQPVFGDDSWFVQHQQNHLAFLPRVFAMKGESPATSNFERHSRLLKLMVNWLVFHILQSDRQMAGVVLAVRRGATLAAAKQEAQQQMGGVMAHLIETILAMYEDLVGRSLQLMQEKNQRHRAERELSEVHQRRETLGRTVSSLEKVIAAMATTIEMRSPFTAGHHRRVSSLVAAISRELGVSEDEANGYALAAMIHDIGDVQIPTEILIKPGAFSAVEREMMKGHAQAGFDIVKGIESPWPIAEIIQQHHERLDGSGYPKGLRNGEIVRGARILAVADIVEAMSSHRPYRPALGIDAALAEINSKKDRTLDAEVVDACTRLFRERGFQFPN